MPQLVLSILRQSQSLPFQGRWLGEAETERSLQICDNLSVSFADSSPGRGALGLRKSKASPCQGEVPNAVRRRGYTSRKKVQTSKSGLHLLFIAVILKQLVANLIPPYQAARSQTYVR